MTQLPDIQELEAVTSRSDYGYVLRCGGSFLFTVQSFGLLTSMWFRVADGILGALTLVATGLLVYLFLNGFVRWAFYDEMVITTDSGGLTAQRPFRTHYIPWESVRKINLVGGKLGKTHLTVITQDRTLALLRDISPIPAIEASIHMHLRRHGLADLPFLSEGALSVWYGLPEGIPEEVDWEPPAPDGLVGVDRVEVRREGISVHAAERVRTVPWKKINRVMWAREQASGGEALGLFASKTRESIGLPFHRDDAGCIELVQAIIRHLRRMEPPVLVPVPDDLWVPLRLVRWMDRLS